MNGEARLSRAILWGGLIAGTLDLTAALISTSLRGRSPVGVLHFIASGLLGDKGLEGGASMAAFGVLLHYVIAYGATTVYALASRKLGVMVREPVVSGLLYGAFVYLFMNCVVLPLSALPVKPNYTSTSIAIGQLIIMVCIGLPIALIVRRYSRIGG
jgi:hypothetical protein